MTDDLVKRLNIRRENMGIWAGSVLLDLYEKERKEAADRIEKLELVEKAYQQNQQTWSRNIARIEKLEARVLLLEGYLNGALNVVESFVACDTKKARKALEGKDG